MSIYRSTANEKQCDLICNKECVKNYFTMVNEMSQSLEEVWMYK
jgi:hypothetical protein